MEGDASQGRIYWRSRRGLLELELLLIPFVRERFEELPQDDQDRYVRLLEHEDLDIYDWLQGRSKPEDESLHAIVDRIRRHKSSRV